MRLPDGTVLMHGDLEHRQPYDARKAHEYYLRTRKLKGRDKGKGDVLTPVKPGTSTGGIGKPAVKHKPQLSPQQKHNKEFIQITAKRLKELNARLEKKVADKQAAKASFKAPKTAGDKKKEKEQEPKAPDSSEELKSQIDNLHQRLTSALAKLQNIDIPTPEQRT